jgi:hypothetical protein
MTRRIDPCERGVSTLLTLVIIRCVARGVNDLRKGVEQRPHVLQLAHYSPCTMSESPDEGAWTLTAVGPSGCADSVRGQRIACVGSDLSDSPLAEVGIDPGR